MSRVYTFLIILALAGCMEDATFAPLANVDRIVIGPYAFKQYIESKRVEINDKRVIEKIVLITNLQLSKSWKPFIGKPGTRCSQGISFFSGNKYLGTLSFSNSKMATTPMPNPSVEIYSGMYLLQDDATVEIESLRKLIGNDNLQGICPEQRHPSQGANPSINTDAAR